MELKQTGMMSYIGTLPATLSKHPSEINIQFLHGVVETLIVQTVTVCTITELEVNKCDVTDVHCQQHSLFHFSLHFISFDLYRTRIG